jgi:hypothetical protein
MAPARTGRERSRRMAVINTDHTKRGVRSHVIPTVRILIIVVIKFTAPKIDEAPAKCKLKMDKSTDAPA